MTAVPSQNIPGSSSKKNQALSEQRLKRIKDRQLNQHENNIDSNDIDKDSQLNFVHEQQSEIHPDTEDTENENSFRKQENVKPLIKLPYLNKESLSQEELNYIQHFQEEQMQSLQKHIEFLYNYIAYQGTRIEDLEKQCEENKTENRSSCFVDVIINLYQSTSFF